VFATFFDNVDEIIKKRRSATERRKRREVAQEKGGRGREVTGVENETAFYKMTHIYLDAKKQNVILCIKLE
jgi:hypothetical protein